MRREQIVAVVEWSLVGELRGIAEARYPVVMNLGAEITEAPVERNPQVLDRLPGDAQGEVLGCDRGRAQHVEIELAPKPDLRRKLDLRPRRKDQRALVIDVGLESFVIGDLGLEERRILAVESHSELGRGRVAHAGHERADPSVELRTLVRSFGRGLLILDIQSDFDDHGFDSERHPGRHAQRREH